MRHNASLYRSTGIKHPWIRLMRKLDRYNAWTNGQKNWMNSYPPSYSDEFVRKKYGAKS